MPTATYIPLQTITLGSSTTSVTFGSIPGTYRDLVLITDNMKSTTGQTVMGLQFNNNSSTSYTEVRMYGDGSGIASDLITGTAFDGGFLSNSTNSMQTITHIFDYAATDKHKTVLLRWNVPQQYVGANAMRWANTSAITSIRVFASNAGAFTTGTTLSLYGIAG